MYRKREELADGSWCGTITTTVAVLACAVWADPAGADDDEARPGIDA
jgi:hypothetical protein